MLKITLLTVKHVSLLAVPGLAASIYIYTNSDIITGSGSIDRPELKQVLLSCMEESSLKLSEENLDALTTALFTEADVDGSGLINFDELVTELQKHPEVMNNLSMG